MKTKLTIGERLRDLRDEKKLSLDELAAKTGISKSALGNYEQDEYNKDIASSSLIILAGFYDVSVDYLLCLTDNRHPATSKVEELHLDDNAVELLKSEKINNRLLCEMMAHPDFVKLMTDLQIYADGYADMMIQTANATLEVLRMTAVNAGAKVDSDYLLDALKGSKLDENTYFLDVIRKDIESIIGSIRNAHKTDTESAVDVDLVDTLKDRIEEIKATQNDPLISKLMIFFCKEIDLPLEQFTDQEKEVVEGLFKRCRRYKKEVSLLGKKGKRR